MKNLKFLFLLLTVVEIQGKIPHPVPTYFGRRHPDGTVVDRKSQEYENGVKKPMLSHISREDSSSSIKILPNPATHGGKVNVTWSGVLNPNEKDYIAYYCPFFDNPTHYLDYFYVSDSTTWKSGYGTHAVVVYNMRSNCIFKYYRAGSHYSQLVAQSQELSFQGGPTVPLQGHIMMTSSPTEMRVMWVSGEVNEPAMVKFGLDMSLKNIEYEVIVNTYSADSFCHAPANSTGFWHPGYIFDALLKDLRPITTYYYSYGTKSRMSDVFKFTTPLPAGDSTPYKMIVYGDQGTDAYPQGVETAILIRQEIDKNDVKFVFHHGDISYAEGFAYTWEKWFYLIEPYSTLIPYMIGIGNHEYDHSMGGIGKDKSGAKGEIGFHPSWFNGGHDSGGECGIAMYHRFHMPDNGNTVFWYSFDYGLAHYIMMSTEHDYSPGSPQYIWLENDLKNVDRAVTPWVMIAGHRAMYCSESEESDYVVAINMQRLFEDLLYKYKVDLAFWAHYHSYERTCKVYKGVCIEDGVTHIVVGSAGKSIDPDVWYGKEWSVFHKTEYGYGRVTIANSSAMLYEWIQNTKNEVIDHVWLIK